MDARTANEMKTIRNPKEMFIAHVNQNNTKRDPHKPPMELQRPKNLSNLLDIRSETKSAQ